MAIDKGIYQAPKGLEGLDADMPEEALEIEIEGEGGSENGIAPEITINADGTVEITLEKENNNDSNEFDENLAEVLSEGVLASLASELVEQVEADISARKDWADTYVKGLDVLGLKYEERTGSTSGCCTRWVWQAARSRKFILTRTLVAKSLSISPQKT